MKILLLDIETAPHKVYTWGLWNQNVAINQIEEPGYTLCWAAKWYEHTQVLFASLLGDTKEQMLQGIWNLLDEADVVVHFNGTKFDIPTLNQEFLSNGMKPPSTFKEVDLYRVVKKRFRFPSNKLSFIAEQLKIGSKVNHKGMELWRECMSGDQEAWRVMEQYNIQDVRLLEQLYNKLRAWITNHPNHGLFNDEARQVCPNCGGVHLQRRGHYYTKTLRYQRYRCNDCGAWSRTRTTDLELEKRRVIMVGV